MNLHTLWCIFSGHWFPNKYCDIDSVLYFIPFCHIIYTSNRTTQWTKRKSKLLVHPHLNCLISSICHNHLHSNFHHLNCTIWKLRYISTLSMQIDIKFVHSISHQMTRFYQYSFFIKISLVNQNPAFENCVCLLIYLVCISNNLSVKRWTWSFSGSNDRTVRPTQLFVSLMKWIFICDVTQKKWIPIFHNGKFEYE